MRTMRKATDLPDVVPADIESALANLGIEAHVQDDEAMALCPNPQHRDSSPSWSCNLETGKHHCFSCGFGGSFRWLVQVVNGARAGEATAWIRTQKVRLGVATMDIDVPPPSVHEADMWSFTEPPEDALIERDLSLQACHDLEITFDHAKNWWICVLRDPFTDRLIGWQSKGRGDESHLVINHPAKIKKASTVFGYRHLKKTGTDGPVLVVENPLKAARFYRYGVGRVVSTLGASFTDYQINELLWPLADDVYFALDNDIAAYRRLSKFISDNPYARSRVKIFNYGTVTDVKGAYVHTADDRDPGHLTEKEIRHGLAYATPAAFTYFQGVDWT